jgi:hypothetical protein
MAGPAAPEYAVGPSSVFSPDALATDARILNGQINALDNANWDRPPQELFDAWTAFMSEWRGWYTDTFGGFFTNLGAALDDANRDTLIQYERRFQTFAQQYQSASGNALPGGVVVPSTGDKDSFGAHLLNQLQPLIPSLDAVYVLVGIGVAGFLIYLFREPIIKVIKKVAK